MSSAERTHSELTRLLSFRKAGLLYFVGTDHLGSTIRVADAGFVAVDQMRYLPFGSSRDAGVNLKTDHRYTGQIEDQSIGWYWYRSRAYDPALGRFVCPDSIVPEAGNPQTLNRYSYAKNSPLRYADPTGHAVIEDAGVGGSDPYYSGASDDWVFYVQPSGIFYSGASDDAGVVAGTEYGGIGSQFSSGASDDIAGPTATASGSGDGGASAPASGGAPPLAESACAPVDGYDPFGGSVLALGITDWPKQLQEWLWKNVPNWKWIDYGAGSKGGRLFHLDWDTRHGWHFNADKGFLAIYNHLTVNAVLRAVQSSTTRIPIILPRFYLDLLDPYGHDYLSEQIEA